jgi:hypothetical protein
MTAQQIAVVKQYQREYKEAFGTELIVDFAAMNGVLKNGDKIIYTFKEQKRLIDNYLAECLVKYSANLFTLQERRYRVHKKEFDNYRTLIIDFSRYVIFNNLSREYAAKLINRHRSLLYHFAKMQLPI